MLQKNSKKVLLHTCCAPCLIKCEEVLRHEGLESTLFWYNLNIHPWTEYNLRKTALIEYANLKNLKIILKDSYNLESFIKWIYPDFSRNRCKYCYKMRIEETAKCAVENGYEYFSTTLLISPYQDHELIKKLSVEIASKYFLEFIYIDFRNYFRQGQQIARQHGIYMQKYCGCIFSEQERYLKS